MKTQSLVELTTYNSLKISASAKQLIAISNLDDLRTIYMQQPESINDSITLGAGSNILFTKPIYATILVNKILGIQISQENATEVELCVGAGEDWDNLVEFCVTRNFYGLENLSLIPGTVGATPIQNIGAYGVEIKDFIQFVDVWDKRNGTTMRLSNAECEFSYRSSRFKADWRHQYIITHVGLRLSKQPNYNLSYPALQQYMQTHNLTATLSNIRSAVIAIRQSKLPDPKLIPNAGSFFKNPVIDAAQFNTLKQQHPSLPHYPVCAKTVKLPAAWLIEQCGFNGKQLGQAAVHKQQALVLINLGNAVGKDILELAHLIQQSVAQQFAIELEFEVNLL